MNGIVPRCRLYHWAAVCFSGHCIRLSGRQYSVAGQFVVDSERARLLTSFYYQGAIDKAANKVCKFCKFVNKILFYSNNRTCV